MHTLLEMPAGSGQGAHVPAFLAKLWKLVDDPATNDLIYWNEAGNSFVIRNQAKFSRELLPLYYKHNNMASFVRQLNMYGFHKVVSVEQGGLKLEKDEMEFAHPFFLRGNEASLELIKRKIPAPKHDDGRIRPDSLQKVLIDVRQMKGRQENMDSKLLTMKRENEALWRELAALRQKHANQTTILSKILQFLVGMMSARGSNHRLSFKRPRMPLMLNDSENEGQEPSKKTKIHLGGPVIHDVTGLFEDAEVEPSSNEPIPNVDSPLGAGGDSVLGLAVDDVNNSDVLLSVDPAVVNPTPVVQEVRKELGSHVDDVQLGLDNLKDILKGEDYKLDNSTLLGVRWPLSSSSSSISDPLHQLFGDGDLNLNDGGGNGEKTGQELMSYNPSLFELTEDGSQFFDDSSNMFLDDELSSMLTTDRDKLKELQDGNAAQLSSANLIPNVEPSASTSAQGPKI